jgi:hypothetical protein
MRPAVPLALLVLLAIAPSSAHASCAPRKPVEQLRSADAAFVGRLVEGERDGFLTFALDEVVKGQLPERLQVANAGGLTTIGLRPHLGEPVALFLHSGEVGGFHATDCDATTPEAMRAARAHPDAPCLQPRLVAIRRVRRGLLTRFAVTLAGLDDRDNEVRVRWGDGDAGDVRVRRTLDDRGTAVVGHRYRRAGSYVIRLYGASHPAPECGLGPETTRPRYLRIAVGH